MDPLYKKTAVYVHLQLSSSAIDNKNFICLHYSLAESQSILAKIFLFTTEHILGGKGGVVVGGV